MDAQRSPWGHKNMRYADVHAEPTCTPFDDDTGTLTHAESVILLSLASYLAYRDENLKARKGIHATNIIFFNLSYEHWCAV